MNKDQNRLYMLSAGKNNSFVQALKKRSSLEKKGIRFINSGTEELYLSYKDLYHKSLYMLHNLQEEGLKKGDLVIFQFEENHHFLISFWACLLGGIIPVPVSVGRNEMRLDKVLKIWEMLGDPFLLGNKKILQKLIHPNDSNLLSEGLNREKVLEVESLLYEKQQGQLVESQGKDLAYIQFSSGSTSSPKGVKLTHENLLTNAADINQRLGTGPDDRLLSWMPLTHDMGLICFHLSALLAGVDQFLMPSFLFVRRPVLWMDKVDEYRITQLYSPNFGLHYFLSAHSKLNKPKNWDLSCLRVLVNGAEPISYDLCQKFENELAAYGMKRIITPGYGLAEASVAVALPDEGDPIKCYRLSRSSLNLGERVSQLEEGSPDSFLFVETGYALDNCEIRIWGDGQQAEDFVIGEIQIRGGNVSAGYFKNPTANKKTFTADGWLKTGDLGFMNKGRLVITGRLKNIIIINGQNYYPHDLETSISQHMEEFGLGKVVCCSIREEGAVSESLLVFLLYKGKPQDFVAHRTQVAQIIAEVYGLEVKEVIPVRRIPKTTSGKIQNFVLVQKYQAGEYNEILGAISELSKNTAPNTSLDPARLPLMLKAIWDSLLPDTNIDLDSDLFFHGLNSVLATSFLNRIKTELKVDLNFSQLFNRTSLSGLAEAILDQGQPLKQSGIAVAPQKAHYPLTSIQKRFWIGQLAHEDESAFNLVAQIKIAGNLNVAALERAFQRLISAHEALRTVFVEVDHEPRQQILHKNDLAFNLEIIEAGRDSSEEEIFQLLATHAQDPIILSQWPLFSIRLIRIHENLHYFSFKIHHIISDGWSIGIMLERVNAYYKEEVQSIESEALHLPFQYSDYLVWHEQQLNTQSWNDSKKYWIERLSQFPEPLQLHISKARPAVKTYAGDSRTFHLKKDELSRLNQYCYQNHVSPFIVLCAALRILLYKHSGQTDVVIGTNTFGRTERGLENQLGCFINTLPLRMAINEQQSFARLLGQEKEGILTAFEHQHFSLDDIINELGLSRDLGRTPVFDVLLLYQNLEKSFSFTHLLEDLDIQPVETVQRPAMTDLEFELFDEDDGMSIHIHYNTDLFEGGDIEWMGQHYISILEAALTDSHQQLKKLDCISAQESSLIQTFSNPLPEQDRKQSIMAMFGQQVAKNPTSVALVCDDRSYTYRELDQHSSRIAARLVDQYGIRKGDRIGVFMHPGEWSIVVLVALQKIGVSYVPMDINYPLSRVEKLFDDAAMRLIITDDDSVFAENHECSFVHINTIREVEASGQPIIPESTYQEGDLAYIMYTSGSTGEPKGVMISHESLVDYVCTFKEYFSLTPKDRVIQQSSLAFDVSVEEIFPTLCTGATLIISSRGASDIEYLLKLIQQQEATILSTTPLVINELNQHPQFLKTLRVLISGGDVLKPRYVDRLQHKLDIYNTYGPTETTVCVTYNKIENLDNINVIGKPLTNHEIIIRNEAQLPAPLGVAGEICVSGKGVFQGYLNKDQETEAVSFVDEEGKRWYMTGDMGLWLSDGKIKFLGRKNRQLKWRGYRIEPREVEHAICEYPQVEDALVMLQEVASESRLTAYVVSDRSIDTRDLAEQLLLSLPPYMVPVAYVSLPELPRNANGKIDLKSLPKPVSESIKPSANTKDIQPKNEYEKRILKIWQEVFERADIGLNEHFYQLGGQSLMAAKISSRVYHQLGFKVNLRDILVHPSIRKFSQFLLTQPQPDVISAEIEKAADQTHYPLSSAQKRMWMVNQMAEDSSAYNLSWKLTFDTKYSGKHLQKALGILIERHESLRTVYKIVNGEPRQFILDHSGTYLSSLISTFHEIADADFKEILHERIHREFDLEHGPLISALFVLNENKSMLFLIMHHIITDGWSMAILQRELEQILSALDKNEKVALPELTIQYKDFASWESKQLEANDLADSSAKKFWKNYLQGAESINWGLQKNHETGEKSKGRTKTYALSPKLVQGLQKLAKEHDTTLFTLFVSLLNILFHRYTGKNNITFGTINANRNRLETENLIGYFLHTLPIHTRMKPEAGFIDLLAQVKQDIGQIFQHKNQPINVMEMAEIKDQLFFESLFDILLVVQNFHFEAGITSAAKHVIKYEEVANETSIGNLLVEVNQLGGNWNLKLRYNTSVFADWEIDHFQNHLIGLCRQVLKQPDQAIQKLKFLSKNEKIRLKNYSQGLYEHYESQHVIELFDRQCAQQPNNIAVVVNDEAFTYREIQIQTQKLAAFLEQQGIKSGDRVGVSLGRSEKLVITILALFRKGMVYVPIDPDYPEKRRTYMAADAGIESIIVDFADSTTESYRQHVRQIIWSEIEAALSSVNHTSSKGENLGSGLAYIMYTSGSTGNPKGVMISHQALADYTMSCSRFFDLGIEDRFIHQSSISFDISLEEIFPILASGGTLIMAPDGGKDIAALLEVIEKNKATHISTTPQVVRELNKHSRQLASLKTIISGGDVLKARYIDRLIKHIRIYNTYGPTEATICASYFLVEDINQAEAIGKPIANHKIFLLDENMEQVPEGIAGEIYIAGSGLAQGYWQLPEETEQAFVNLEIDNKTERLYRTGDIAYWDNTGNLHFMGRRDEQVKINAYRVELQEVEKSIAAHEDVVEAAAMIIQSDSGVNRLFAAIIGRKPLDLVELRNFLFDNLPHYMVPARLLQIDEIPITDNGKTDYRALEKSFVQNQELEQAYTPAAEETKAQILKFWQEIFETAEIDISRNFFELGGQSILATSLLSKINQHYQASLNLKDIFRYPTIHEQAVLVEKAAKQEDTLTVDILSGQEYYETSNAQKRIWFLNELSTNKSAYNICWATQVEGSLNKAALEMAFKSLFDRHESLRTVFFLNDDSLKQRVLSPASTEEWFEGLEAESIPESQLEQAIQQEASEIFDLEKGPLFKYKWFALSDEKHVLCFCIHHIVADGWSVDVLMRDLHLYYHAYLHNQSPRPAKLIFQYKDYANFMKQRIASGQFKKSEKYWLEKFGEIPSSLHLPLQNPRPLIRKGACGLVEKVIDNSLSDQLSAFAIEKELSPFMLYLAGLNMLLYRYTGQSDIVIGTPVSGRNLPNLENLLGCFVNTLAIRTSFSPELMFTQLLDAVRETTLEAYEHQVYPFDKLIEKLNLERDTSHSPLFDVMIVFHEKNYTASIPSISADTVFSRKTVKPAGAKFDLVLNLFQEDNGLRMSLEYDAYLFEEAFCQRLLHHLENILRSAITQQNFAISQLDFLDLEERKQLLNGFNLPIEKVRSFSVLQMIDQIAHAEPDRLAVVCGPKNLTYGQLIARADDLAHMLIHEKAVSESDFVALLTDRSEYLLIGLLGILKAKAAYVPIDPAYPTNRKNHILQDSGAKVILTLDQYIDTIPKELDVVLLNQQSEETGNFPNSLPVKHSPDSPAYLIYTSGSTGQPKGVIISRGNLQALLDWAIEEFADDDIQTVYGTTSYCFDLSVFEVFYSLCTGKVLRMLGSALELEEYLSTDQKILINTVPSVVEALVANRADFSHVAALNMAGESIPLYLKSKIPLDQHKIRNLYGPSEDTTYSTCYKFNPADEQIPIGKPIQNTAIYLLDKHLNLVPKGVVGEIAIEGEGLAKGYLNKPDETKRKFIQSPINKQNRMYLTGDMAKILPEGDILFLGRNDSQVKVRGYRIELGEVEKCMSQFPSVTRAVVLLHVLDGEKQLLSFFTADKKIASEEIRSYMEAQLPSYFIPEHIVQLDLLPLNHNGKIDRSKILVQYEQNRESKREWVTPSNQSEYELASLWEHVLKVKVSAHDNFFKLGGHSLKAVQLVKEIKEKLELEIHLQDVFSHPTIVSMAKLLGGRKAEVQRTISPVEKREHYALSHTQRRLWIIDKLQQAPGVYNMSGVYKLTGKVNIRALQAAYDKLVERYEILRTAFVEIEGEPRQQIKEKPGACPIQMYFIHEETLDENELLGRINEDNTKPFILSNWPLIRLSLYTVNDHLSYFSITIHHIITDGLSMPVLLEKILTYYKHFTGQEEMSEEPLAIQYKDFSEWQHQQIMEGGMKQAGDYWHKKLGGDLPRLNLPGDYPRPALKTHKGGKYICTLDANQSAKLRTAASEMGVTPFMLLLAILKGLFYKLSGSTDIIIGTVASGRNQKVLDDQIGFFANTLALRTQFDAHTTIAELTEKVSTNILEAYEHQAYPFDKLIEELKLRKEVNRSPLFDVMVLYEDEMMDTSFMQSIHELIIHELPYFNGLCKYDLTYSFKLRETLELSIEYNRDLFSEKRISYFAALFEKMLSLFTRFQHQSLRQLQLIDHSPNSFLGQIPENSGQSWDLNTDIVALFERQVADRPEALAICYEDKHLSYADLNTKANQLANRLIRDYGINPEDRVGVLLERSEKMIISILGILKAGGAYVPLNAEMPSERQKYICQDSGMKVLITQKDFEHLPTEVPCIYLKEILATELDESDPKLALKPENLIYTIYTSGTTGQPKGVMVEHKSVVNLVYGLSDILYQPAGSMRKVLLNASISFDSSVKQIFPALLNGGELHIVPDKIRKQPAALMSMIQEKGINIFDSTPSFLQFLVAKNEFIKSSVLFTLIGGEPVDRQLVEHYYAVFGSETRLVNVYGLTETTVDNTLHMISPDEEGEIPIGKALPNNHVFILDQDMNPVPAGVPGEICVGGLPLSRGYLNREELTDQKFFFHEEMNDLRLFRTGDFGKWNFRDEVVFIGRKDKQVKIRGYRIELKEIEAVLCRIDGIKQAVVKLRKDKNQEAYLTAYLVHDWIDFNVSNIKNQLQKYLPEYMIPAFILSIEELPLTSHGKLDEEALPDPIQLLKTAEAPAEAHSFGKLGDEMLEIWKDVLQRNDISFSDNFFEIGGNSFKVIRLFERLNVQYPGKIKVHELFSAATLNKQLDILITRSDEKHDNKVTGISIIDF